MLPQEPDFDPCHEAGSNSYIPDNIINQRAPTQNVVDMSGVIGNPVSSSTEEDEAIQAFHTACVTGNIKRIKLLLDSGALGDVNSDVCGFHGERNEKLTPVCCAASSRNFDAIQILLNYGADVNRCSGTGGKSPFHFALEGNEDSASCVAGLMSTGADPNATDVNGRTPLHMVVANDGRKDITECLRLLVVDNRVDINAQDIHGFTALHLCTMNQNRKCAAILLRHGSDVTLKTSEGTTALSMLIRNIPEAMEYLEERMDSGVTLHNFDPSDTNCEIKMDFSVLISKGSKRSNQTSFGRWTKHLKNNSSKAENTKEKTRRAKETTLLTYLVSTGNKNLLMHPLAEAFLFLKWHRVRKFFLASFLFQMALVALYTIFVVEMYLSRCPYIRNHTTSGAASHKIEKRSAHPSDDGGGFSWFSFNPSRRAQNKQGASKDGVFMDDSAPHIPPTESSLTPPPYDITKKDLQNNCTLTLPLQIIQFLLVVIISLMALQEVFQFLHKPSKYFKSGENWVQCFIMASVLITVCFRSSDAVGYNQFQMEYWQYPAAAIGILTTWAFTLFQVGRFPAFGVYMEMLGKVAANFGLFILAYACLFIAFALSFCVLFPEHPPFSSVPLAIIKVFTMMVGEVDYEDLFYSDERSHDPFIFAFTIHILFATFVLVMTIVLMNLLVGLAVSDIQGLQKGARLDRLCRQTASIARFESFIFSKKLEALIPTPLIRIVQESSLLYVHSGTPSNDHHNKHSYDLSLNFRPNDKNDHSLPIDIKQAALNLVVAPSSRRWNFNNYDTTKKSIEYPSGSNPLSYFQDKSLRQHSSPYSDRYLQYRNISHNQSDDEVMATPNARYYQTSQRLDQLETKLVTLEEGVEKILQVLMAKRGELT